MCKNGSLLHPNSLDKFLTLSIMLKWNHGFSYKPKPNFRLLNCFLKFLSGEIFRFENFSNQLIFLLNVCSN